MKEWLVRLGEKSPAGYVLLVGVGGSILIIVVAGVIIYSIGGRDRLAHWSAMISLGGLAWGFLFGDPRRNGVD